MSQLLNPETQAVVGWAFNVDTWDPSAEEWETLLASVEPEESTRIMKFRFEQDRKRGLAGRVLLRRMVGSLLGSDSFTLARTQSGKPYLKDPVDSDVSFNLSHHGKWVVAVGHKNSTVGVDVMEYEPPKGGQTLSEYFKLMNNIFTPEEWKYIIPGSSGEELNMSHLERFLILWSLKEAYMKALGDGIGFGLQRASFNVQSHSKEIVGSMDSHHVWGSATLSLDGEINNDFTFVIQHLDDLHCVSVAIQNSEGSFAAQHALEFGIKWYVIPNLLQHSEE